MLPIYINTSNIVIHLYLPLILRQIGHPLRMSGNPSGVAAHLLLRGRPFLAITIHQIDDATLGDGDRDPREGPGVGSPGYGHVQK